MLNITPLFSGSSGNCVHIKSKKTEILIDAGVSFRSLSSALKKIGTGPENISAVFVTHEHTDHIAGLEVFCKQYGVSVYVNCASAEKVSESGKCPCMSRCIKHLQPHDTVSIGDLCIRAFKTPHDSVGSVGYRVDTEDMSDSFSYCTDIGYVTRDIAYNIFGSKTVVFEANHDVEMLKHGRYPEMLKQRILSHHGHLSNDDCSVFLPHLAKNGAKRIILAHLSEDNNTPAIAYETCRKALCLSGFDDVLLEVAPRSILDK